MHSTVRLTVVSLSAFHHAFRRYLPILLVMTAFLYLALLPIYLQGTVTALVRQLAAVVEPTSPLTGLQLALSADAAIAVRRAVATTARTHQEHIFAVQRRGTLLSMVGAFLGIVATASVGRLIARQHTLATRERAARMAADEARAEAEARRKQLEEMTASRAALVRGFSHDVRTPLGNADGYLYLLERDRANQLTPTQADAIAKCRHSVQSAVQLIGDLLTVACTDSAEVEIHRVVMDLGEAARNVVEDYRGAATRKGLALVAEPAPAPIMVSCDPARVTQILANLVGNAIKYTPGGIVRVRVGIRRSADGVEQAVVDVADTGPGIDRKHHRHIFREFERRDTTEAAGTGIGLTISQRLAKLLGGEITLQSEPGLGSTFTLWLPLDSIAV